MSMTKLSYYWTNTIYTYILGCANKNRKHANFIFSPYGLFHWVANERAHCQFSSDYISLASCISFPPNDSHLHRCRMPARRTFTKLLPQTGFSIRPDAASFTHRGCFLSGTPSGILHSKLKSSLFHWNYCLSHSSWNWAVWLPMSADVS